MRAAIIERKGEPEVLRIGDVPEPELGAGRSGCGSRPRP